MTDTSSSSSLSPKAEAGSGFYRPGLDAATTFPTPPAAPSGTALRRMASEGVISVDAMEAALGYLGIRPGPREWAEFGKHVLTICGTLFLTSGIIFFFAWNWADMHRYVKFGLIQGVILLCFFSSLRFGFDTLPGRAGLLAAGIVIGPLLAVYGQAYQTGAEIWELFRVWTVLLIPLAVAGRQTGLWFLVWLAGTLWGESYMGRHDLLGMPFVFMHPEFILGQILFLVCWETASRRWGATRPWLTSRWLPRLVLFCVLISLTSSVCWLILSSDASSIWRDRYEATLFLPDNLLNFILYVATMVGMWHWYRKKSPDLFMLACGVLSVDFVVVSALLRARFLAYTDTIGILLWGLIISGLAAINGKLLRAWHGEMERENSARTEPRAEPPGFFAGFAGGAVTWQDIWARLRGLGLLAADAAPPLAAPAGAPWYIFALQAFGGWVSSILLMVFLALFLSQTLHMDSDFEHPLLVGGGIMLGIGIAALRKRGVILRQFGLANVMAGSGAVSIALGLMTRHTIYWPLFAALGALAGYPFVRSASFRLLSTVAGFCLLSLGIEYWLWGDIFRVWKFHPRLPMMGEYGFAGKRLVITAWWAALCLGLVWGWLNEKRWIASRRKARAVPPFLHGLYISLLAGLIISLFAPYGITILAFRLSSSSMGVAAGIGIVFLAHRLTACLPLHFPVRLAWLAAAALTMMVGGYLPGVSVALLGMMLSRYTGDRLFLGGTFFFLFVYLVYYYYNLNATLLHKSLTLMAAGAAMLCAGCLLPKVPSGKGGSGQTDTGCAHA